MNISKRMRFEVFKRDGFACQYCGQQPPKVLLEVDHVNPKSKGGPDDINNLITACADCNRGKSDVSLKKIPATLSKNVEIIKEKEDQLREYNKALSKIRKREDASIESVEAIFTEYFPGYVLNQQFCDMPLRRFVQELPQIVVEDAMRQACHYMKSVHGPDAREDGIRYFCGICWKKVRGESRG